MLSLSWTQITDTHTNTLERSVLLHVACKIHICTDLRQMHKSRLCVCEGVCQSVSKVECLAKRLIMYSLKWQMPTRTASSYTCSSSSSMKYGYPKKSCQLQLQCRQVGEEEDVGGSGEGCTIWGNMILHNGRTFCVFRF